MNVLDLFSGVGAFSLGLERAGFRTCAFVEIDPYCRRVLAKHWPEVPQYHDVRELTADRLHADGIFPDVICGGFPCQDISIAGKGAGIGGERSGLWSEFARLIGEIRPRYVLVENVAALLVRGIDRVLGDLAALGYDAEWEIISAASMGAPHRRERVWIVAYSECGIEPERGHPDEVRAGGTGATRSADPAGGPGGHGQSWDVAYPEGRAWQLQPGEREDLRDEPAVDGAAWRLEPAGLGGDVADANDRDGYGRRGWREGEAAGLGDARGNEWRAQSPVRGMADGIFHRLDQAGIADPWADGEWPGVPRVAKGVPDRVSRLSSLGNSLVPQIPEMLGRAILAREEAA